MLRRVLYSTDGSQFAEKALACAVELAKQCGGELRVVTVVENPVFYGVPEATALYDAEFYRSLSGELEKLAKAALERAGKAAEEAGVKATSTVRHGTPGDEIVAEAKDWGADVMVLSTHGRSGLARLLLGSVANSVVTHAPCPVLLCRVRNAEPARV
jgi:nucleotide-binding universal stress UspA family protein